MYFFYFLFLLFPAIINSEIRQHYFGVSQYIASGNCSTYREQFANYSALFMLCAVESSRPIKLCKNCVESYIHVIESYQNMSKVIVNDSTCLDVYNNHDRLRIVETIYSNTEALWSNAKCYECFLIVNNTQTNIISNVTNKFEDYYQDFTNCVSRTRTDDPCSLCMENYNILNNYFTGISNINEKISYCMDIVDIGKHTDE